MKRFNLLFVLALVVLGVQIAAAQSLEAVVERAINAYGGQAKLETVNTMTMKMSGKMQGAMDMEMTMFTAKPDKFRMEMRFMGQNMIIGSTGSDTWMQMMGRVMDVPGAQGESNKMMSRSFGGDMLLSLKEQGAVYSGSGDFLGEACEIISVVDESKNKTDMHFSKNSGLMVGIKAKAEGSEVMIKIGDYRDVQGFKIPHSMETLMGGSPMMTMNVSDVKINTPLEDTLFSRPK
jgi:outer membrane lipoprotein-sorting protein